MTSLHGTLIKVSLGCFILSSSMAFALPLLEEPVPLPADFDGVISIFPDNHNTPQVQNFWLVPSVARICRNPDTKKLAFGLVHSGLSSFDPDGVGALLTGSFQPYVDEATSQKAKKLIADQVEKSGGKAFFRFIAPKETQVWFKVGGQNINWDPQKPDSVIHGGLVEACIGFQVKLKDVQDARAVSQAGGDDVATIGVDFRMKFDGIRGRCHFTIIGKFKETYEHFKAQIGGSGWWGLVRASSKVELQKLESKDAIKVVLDQCTREKFDKYYPAQAVDGLLTQMAARTGAFARTLKPSGLPDAPGGGGFWGWSLSVGGGFEKYDEDREVSYEYDLNFIEEQEILYGMSFPAGGAEMKSYVKNLTDSDKPFPTSDDYKKIRQQMKKCRDDNVQALVKMRDSKVISQDLYDRYIAEATNPKTGCYSDYTLSDLRPLYDADSDEAFYLELKKETMDPALFLEFPGKRRTKQR